MNPQTKSSFRDALRLSAFFFFPHQLKHLPLKLYLLFSQAERGLTRPCPGYLTVDSQKSSLVKAPPLRAKTSFTLSLFGFLCQVTLGGRTKDWLNSFTWPDRCDQLSRDYYLIPSLLVWVKRLVFTGDPASNVRMRSSCSAAHHFDRLSLQVTFMKV